MACWGDEQLMQVDVAAKRADALKRLAAPAQWPDVILIAWRLCERWNGFADDLSTHPGHGFFRLLAMVSTSDEYGRVVLSGFGDAIVFEPVTTDRLSKSMCQVAT